jgi:hypothetical protein
LIGDRFYLEGHVFLKNIDLKHVGPSKYDFSPKLQHFTDVQIMMLKQMSPGVTGKSVFPADFG